MALGREKDLILVDLHESKVYNFGEEGDYYDVEEFVKKMGGPKYLGRFVFIVGKEVGFDSPTGRSVKNPKVRRMKKHAKNS